MKNINKQLDEYHRSQFYSRLHSQIGKKLISNMLLRISSDYNFIHN
jgi:hypothetical protein